MYLFPCYVCAKAIIQSGLTEVIYLSDKYEDSAPVQASKRMLASAGVSLRRLTPSRAEITLDFRVDK